MRIAAPLLALAVALGSAAPASAAITYVGRVASATSAVSATSAAVKTTRAVPAGDAVIVAVLLSSTTTATAKVTDTAGNVYSLDRDQNDGSAADRVLMFSSRSVKALASGATLTVTFPKSAAWHVSADEFTGVLAPDRSASAFATGTSFNSGTSGTTTQSNELVFGVVGNESGNAPVWASGWTALPTLSISTDRLTAAWRLAGAPAAFAASGTISGTWMAGVVTYTPSAPLDLAPVARLSITSTAGSLAVTADGSLSTDTDVTPIGSYRFDFGDGTPPVTITSPTASTPHTYATGGTYTVSLIATDTGGQPSAAATASVTVNLPPPDFAPVAKLTVTNSPIPSLHVTADAAGSTDTDLTPIASYSFDFGDGTPPVNVTAPATTADHTYATGGTYTVTLIATDTGAQPSTAVTADVTVNPDLPPVPGLTLANAASPPRTITADASTSTDTDGTGVATYSFDFGDGTPPVIKHPPTATATHTYAADNAYVVTLVVTDAANLASVADTASIVVYTPPPPELPPVAHLAVTNTPNPSLHVSVDAAGSTDTDLTPIASCSFDFGDGTPPVNVTAPATTTDHTYATGGTYTVTLIATDTGALASTAVTADVTVNPDLPPVPGLTLANAASPSRTITADASTSTDTDGTGVATYSFDFGDGTPPVIKHPPTATATHTYAADNAYVVTLVVTDAANLASVADTASIVVYTPPPPEFPPVAHLAVTNTPNPSLHVAADAAGSTDTDLTPIASYSFDFGDGAPPVIVTAPATTAQHTYATDGAYTVTLIATDSGALPSTPETTTVIVSAPPPDLPPVAKLTLSGAASPVRTVNAGAAGSTDTDLTPIASYSFDFGDGTAPVIVTAPATGATHTYAADGVYTVKLRATDTGNQTSPPDTVSFVVFTPPPPDFAPVAKLTVTNLAPPSLNVKADGVGSTDTDATPVGSYRFDFGDGTAPVTVIAPATSALHTYAAPNTYTVTLTAIDTGNLSSTPVTAPVTVTSSPPAYVGRVASGTVSTSSTTTTLTATRAVAGGDALLVTVLLGSTSTTAVTVTNVAGDVFTLLREQNSTSGGDRTLVFAAFGVHPLAVGGTVKITYPTAASLEATVDEFSNVSALDKAASATATSTAFNSGATATTSRPVELVFGAVGIESGTAAVWASGFTALPALAIGSDRLANAYKVTSATGAYNASGTTSGTWMALVTTFTSGPPPELPPAASLVVTRPASPPLAVTADGSGSTDVDATPIAKYSFDFGDGTAIVTGTAASVAHTYAVAGTYVVKLIVTDTANNPSTQVQASVTVGLDAPPVARLTVTNIASPALTVKADASASTDTDATPIATYKFDFGDGTAVVTTTAPTATAQHTYAAAGSYTVKVTVTDTGNNPSTPATAPVTANLPVGGTSGVSVFVAYYDTHHTSHLKTKPSPWRTSTGVTFVGNVDPGTSDGWDTSTIRILNQTGATVSGVAVTVDMSKKFNLWSSYSIPNGQSLILAQTGFENFDGSDTSPAGCYGCDPADCTRLVSSLVPVVHVTIGGKLTDYFDTGQILNTHGVDGAGCPATGGTRNDESSPWVQVFPKTALLAKLGTPPTGSRDWQPVADSTSFGHVLWLAAPAPNPTRGELGIQYRIAVHEHVRLGIYDVTGRLVRTVRDGELEAGMHTERVDLTGATAGIYFCRMDTSTGSLRGSFVLVR